jgi:glycosyltransferase involved in cell wall biosynthesis
MDVDVILPFHRVDRHFLEAIESLSLSKQVSMHVILVDDRVDQTENIKSVFRPLKKFTIVSTSGGEGYGEALRIGTQASSADIVALFNSDDLVDPMRLAMQSRSLTTSEISVARMERINANGRRSRSISGSLVSKTYHPAYLLLGSYGANASWCMRAEWWKRHSFFDSKESLDWRIALQAFPISKIAYLDAPLYLYRKHSKQVTANKDLHTEIMSATYLAWNDLSKSILKKCFTRGLFDAYGTPWLLGEPFQKSESNLFINLMTKFSKNLDPAIQKNISSLLLRRLLLSSRNNKLSKKDRFNYFVHGAPELGKLVSDFVT